MISKERRRQIRERNWKNCRPGEKLIFGTIISARYLKPKGLFAEIVVHGYRHVGVYKINLKAVEEIFGGPLPNRAGFNLFVDKDMKPTRLYISPYKIFPSTDGDENPRFILFQIIKMYVPYEPQASFDFVHPWESGFHDPRAQKTLLDQ